MTHVNIDIPSLGKIEKVIRKNMDIQYIHDCPIDKTYTKIEVGRISWPVLRISFEESEKIDYSLESVESKRKLKSIDKHKKKENAYIGDLAREIKDELYREAAKKIEEKTEPIIKAIEKER